MQFPVSRLIFMAAIAGVLLVLGGLSAPSEAGGGGKVQFIDPNGEPKSFKDKDTERYAVWHSKTGWHIRTTTAKVEHRFTGKIVVEGGIFEGVEPVHLEDKGKFRDWWKVGAKDREMIIDFKTDRGIDGINFQLSKDAKLIRFNLDIDGKHQKHLIYVGKNGIHPDADPFELIAHPGVK
jgi:hypothetical protein